MTISYDELIPAALALPPGSRAMQAEHLLESLDAIDQVQLDAVWADEAEARLEQVQKGEVTTVPGDQVLAELRIQLKR